MLKWYGTDLLAPVYTHCRVASRILTCPNPLPSSVMYPDLSKPFKGFQIAFAWQIERPLMEEDLNFTGDELVKWKGSRK